MIERSKGELTVECDDCGETQHGGTTDWQQFIQDIKNDGWRIVKDGKEWLHYCEDCARERR